MRVPNLDPTAYARLRMAAALAVTLGIAACGGSEGGGGKAGDSGSLTLAVTDGPVEEADAVFVQFASVTLKPANAEPFTVTLDEAKRIDLLAQRNGNSELLLQDEHVAAGDYEWIRLGVDLGPGETVIVVNGAEHDLQIPSGAHTGLKLVDGFTVVSGGTLALTIDFDLRKSITRTGPSPDTPAFTATSPPPVYKLRPALRLVANDAVGHVSVRASENHVSTRCGADDGGRAVYVFEGAGVVPDDVDTGDADDIDPVTGVALELDADSGDYRGIAGFLDAEIPTTYTVAFTCDPEADLADENDALIFHDPADIEVVAGETARYELPPVSDP